MGKLTESDREFFTCYEKEQLIEMCTFLFSEVDKCKKQKDQLSSENGNLKNKLSKFEENKKVEKHINNILQENESKLNKLLNIPKITRLEKTIKTLQSNISKLEIRLKNTDTYNGCDTKVRYSSDIEAEMALSTIRSKGKVKKSTPIRKYKCNICSGFHLTSQVKK